MRCFAAWELAVHHTRCGSVHIVVYRQQLKPLGVMHAHSDACVQSVPGRPSMCPLPPEKLNRLHHVALLNQELAMHHKRSYM